MCLSDMSVVSEEEGLERQPLGELWTGHKIQRQGGEDHTHFSSENRNMSSSTDAWRTSGRMDCQWTESSRSCWTLKETHQNSLEISFLAVSKAWGSCRPAGSASQTEKLQN